MPRKPLTFDDVRELALVLPDVEASTSYGVGSLKLRGVLMACPAINKSAEPGSMVIRIGMKEREKLIAENPEVFYLTEHYVNYPSVLVRLARIKRNELQNLLHLVWEFDNDKAKPKSRKARK